MEVVDPPAPGLGILEVREAGLRPGCLVDERQWHDRGGDCFGEPLAVLGGLPLHLGEGGPLGLRLDCANGNPVDKEEVVSPAVGFGQDEFAHGHPGARAQIDRARRLNDPACLVQLTVDLDARSCLRGQIGVGVWSRIHLGEVTVGHLASGIKGPPSLRTPNSGEVQVVPAGPALLFMGADRWRVV